MKLKTQNFHFEYSNGSKVSELGISTACSRLKQNVGSATDCGCETVWCGTEAMVRAGIVIAVVKIDLEGQEVYVWWSLSYLKV